MMVYIIQSYLVSSKGRKTFIDAVHLSMEDARIHASEIAGYRRMDKQSEGYFINDRGDQLSVVAKHIRR